MPMANINQNGSYTGIVPASSFSSPSRNTYQVLDNVNGKGQVHHITKESQNIELTASDGIHRTNSAPQMPPPVANNVMLPDGVANNPLVNGAAPVNQNQKQIQPNQDMRNAALPRLGPQGQMMNRSVSSPPASGPIAMSSLPGPSVTPQTSVQYNSLGPSFSNRPLPVTLGNTYPPAFQPGLSNQSNSGMATVSPSGRPGELPMPFHGQAQYSQQVRPNYESGLTPGSEPVSQKSSRAPSPVPGQHYDALEGQFSPEAGKSSLQATPQHNAPPSVTPRSTNIQPAQYPTPPQGTNQPPSMSPRFHQPTPPSSHPLTSGQAVPSSSSGATGIGAPPLVPYGTQPHIGQPRMPPPLGQQRYPTSGAPMYNPSQAPPGMLRPPPPTTSGYTPPGYTGQAASQGQPSQFGILPPPRQPGIPPVPGHPGLPPPPPLPGQAGMHGPLNPTNTRSPGIPPPPVHSSGAQQTLPMGSVSPAGPVGLPPPTSHSGQPAIPDGAGHVSGYSTVSSTSNAVGTSTGRLSTSRYPQMPGQSAEAHQMIGGPTGAYQPGAQPYGEPTNLAQNFNNMHLQRDVTRPLNLLQEKQLIATEGVETPMPNLPTDYKHVNCSPDIFRCTLNAIPNTQQLLNKSRLPLGILIHPFKDLTQLPVIQSNVIVRCRSCRTYINPFVSFVDSRRWKCNLCYRNNELPDEFNYDPVSKTYGEPQRRPEIKSSTIEFIAPSEYMLRPPQAAQYLFVMDVSFNAVSTGYLKIVCDTLLDELERLPGDSRAQIGFITFDTSLYFYNLQEGLSQPQMLVVSDIDDVFLPLPEGLMVNLQESRELVIDLLQSLPDMFQHTTQTSSALGAALQASFKLMTSTGGRVSVFQTILPTQGPGSLKNREDPNERAGKKIQNLGPATDFYKKLALDCSAQQIAVDLFMLNSQYADLASITGISKYSGGCVHYFPGMHVQSNPSEAERFENVLRRYLTRKIGFEAVMRIRCSRGMTLHTFHGNFFVRSTDLLSLPNINPDAGFGMQMSIEDTIETNYFSFQAALLYTSSKGERRIRVHTLCIPVTSSITEVFGGADQVAITALLSKMAVDRCLSHNLGDARDALVNSAVDMLSAYGTTLTSSQRIGQLPCPYTLRVMPAYILALLKYLAFRIGTSTKLDERVNALELCKNLPVKYLMQEVYPDLYPVHMLDDKNALSRGDAVICQPPHLQLSSASLDRHGAYVMDTHTHLYLWLGGALSDQFCQAVFQRDNVHSVPDGMTELPELENETSERLRNFISYLSDQKPCAPAFLVIRDDSTALRGRFLSRLVEDRGEATFSYYEFLQHLQKEVKQ